MIRLNPHKFFHFCFIINLCKAFATSCFTSSLESLNVAVLRSSELFENSQKFCESICEKKDRFIESSSQDNFQNPFLSFSVDGFSNNPDILSSQEKSLNRGYKKTTQVVDSLSIQDPLSIKSDHIFLRRSWEDMEELPVSPPPKKRRFLEKSQDILNDEILTQKALNRGYKKAAQIENSLSASNPLLIKSDSLSLKRSREDTKGPPPKKRRFLKQSQDIFNDEILTQKPLSQSSSQDILTPPLIRSLGQIADDYDVFLVDIVGVIHDGKEAFEHSIQIINNLIKTKKVALISNTPRPHKQPAETLNEMGLDSQVPIFTAGDMVRDDLVNEYKGQKIYHLGAERNQDILRDLDVRTTSTLEHANVVLLTQYIEENESLEEFDSILKDIAARKLVVLCANSDKTATVGEKLRYCAGTLAEKIEDFEGVVRYYGKPDTKLFDLILNKIPDIENIPRNRVLVIGDTLEKDIKGACNSNMHSLLVLTGTTAQDIQRTGQDVKTVLKKLCVHQKTKPTYYINSMK